MPKGSRWVTGVREMDACKRAWDDWLQSPNPRLGRHAFYGIDINSLWPYDSLLNNQLPGERMLSHFDSVCYA
jgi:hypothetical protein